MRNKVNIQDIKRIIEELSLINSVADNLKNIEFNPFMPSSKELTKLKNDLEVILNSYIDTLHELHTTQQVLILNTAVKEENTEIQYLRRQLEERDKRIADLQQQIQWNHSHGRISRADMMRMKELYEQGCSLRTLGARFNCDKNTVKQRLLEMGVQLRVNNGR